MRNLLNSTLPLALVALAVGAMTAAPAAAKLKCKNVKKTRWQVCGDAKPFKSFTVGVGIRFSKKKPGLAAKQAPSKPARTPK